MFEWIMNSPCQNHGFIVTHLAKDCIAYHQRVALEALKRIEQDGYSSDHEDDHDIDAAARSSMLIFGGPQAYQERWLQKLTHRWIYVTAPAAHYTYAGSNGRLLMIEPIIRIRWLR